MSSNETNSEDESGRATDDPWSILVTPPDTESNYMAYFHTDEALDSDYLMAPVCEADYDSETQCCVDTIKADNGPKSFYDHFVTKRKKLKKKGHGKKGQEEENDAPAVPTISTDDGASSSAAAASADAPPQIQVDQHLKPTPWGKRGPAHMIVPSNADLPDPRKGFCDAFQRRRACGYMPPRMEEGAEAAMEEDGGVRGVVAI